MFESRLREVVEKGRNTRRKEVLLNPCYCEGALSARLRFINRRGLGEPGQ